MWIQVALGIMLVLVAYFAVFYTYNKENASGKKKTAEDDYLLDVTGTDIVSATTDGTVIRSLLSPPQEGTRMSVVNGAYLPQSRNRTGGTELTWEFMLKVAQTDNSTWAVSVLRRGNDVRRCPEILLKNEAGIYKIGVNFHYSSTNGQIFHFDTSTNSNAVLAGENVHRHLESTIDFSSLNIDMNVPTSKERYAHVVVAMRDANWDLEDNPSLRDKVRCTVYVNGVGVIDVFCHHRAIADDGFGKRYETTPIHLFPNNGMLTTMKVIPAASSGNAAVTVPAASMSALVYRNRYMPEDECIRVAKDFLRANKIGMPTTRMGLGPHTNSKLTPRV